MRVRSDGSSARATFVNRSYAEWSDFVEKGVTLQPAAVRICSAFFSRMGFA